MPTFPPCPEEVKYIAHYLKIASEHDERNIVISYWSRMYACQVAMKCVPGKKPPEVSALLIAIMDWLESVKKENQDNDGIVNETAAQALIEEYANQLFNYANTQDHAKNYSKNIVKAFYTCGIVLDVLKQFGDLSEELREKRKYAKWKAAYIHRCLKLGQEPIPGPPQTHLYEQDPESEHELDDNLGTAQPPQNPTETPPAGFTLFDEAKAPRINFPDTFQDDDDEPATTTSGNATPSTPSLPLVPTTTASTFPTPQNPSNLIDLPVSPAAPPQIVNPQIPGTPSPLLDAEKIAKAQKYCKFAGSALNYDDVKTAVNNLEKALHLLHFGVEKKE